MTAELFLGYSDQWVDPEAMPQVLQRVIEERVDPVARIVLPEQIKCVLTYDASTGKSFSRGYETIVEQDGLLLPYGSRGKLQDYTDENHNQYLVKPRPLHIGHAIDTAQQTVADYRQLTDQFALRLTQDEHHLLSVLDSRDISYRSATDQGVNAVHISSTDDSRGREKPDFSTLRFYLPSGENGAHVAAAVLGDVSVEIDRMKVWLPTARGSYHKIRHESPIIEVKTYRQLESVVGRISNLLHRANNALTLQNNAPLGYRTTGLPGVYIGQASDGKSFNGSMVDLFAPAIETAIEAFNLRTGTQIRPDWVAAVSTSAENNAKQSCTELGRSSIHHAFLNGQPVKEIMSAIENAV